jgi:hypothetical protein
MAQFSMNVLFWGTPPIFLSFHVLILILVFRFLWNPPTAAVQIDIVGSQLQGLSFILAGLQAKLSPCLHRLT